MKKTNLIKIFFGLVLSLSVIFMVSSVNAADDGWLDETGSLLGGNNSANTGNTGNTGGNTLNTGNTANTGNTNTNTASRLNTNNSNRNTNRNSSIYNSTNLPKTGIGDSLPVAALVVIFGISAVYAYKKIKDYRNI